MRYCSYGLLVVLFSGFLLGGCANNEAVITEEPVVPAVIVPAESAPQPPVSNSIAADVLIFKHGVVFDHKGHQTRKVGICSACHENSVGKIEGFGKDWAHKYCINCHNLRNEGRPTNCGGCHKTIGSLKL